MADYSESTLVRDNGCARSGLAHVHDHGDLPSSPDWERKERSNSGRCRYAYKKHKDDLVLRNVRYRVCLLLPSACPLVRD